MTIGSRCKSPNTFTCPASFLKWTRAGRNKIMENKRTILSGALLAKKLESLSHVKVDATNWTVYYIDILTNEKWVKEYPNSEMHGGGAPFLNK
jgi:hypothetical protein